MDRQTALNALNDLLDKVSISAYQHEALTYLIKSPSEPENLVDDKARQALDAKAAKAALAGLLFSPRLSAEQHAALHYLLDPIPVKTRIIKGAAAEKEKVAQGRTVWERLTKEERESLQAFMGEMKNMTFPDDHGTFMTNRG